MSVFDYLRNSEQSIYDFNTPWSMAIVVLGFLSAWLVTNILEHLGITRHVWHLRSLLRSKTATQQLVVSERLDEYGISRYFSALPQITTGYSRASLVPPTTGLHSKDLLGQQL
jgi:hypothetical protein